LSSTANSAGARQCHQHHQCCRHQVQPPLNSYISPGDIQGDAPDSEIVADNDNNDHKQARREPVIKPDDQHESSRDTRAPLIVGKHADASGFSRTLTLIVRHETDERGYRYNNSRRLSARQSYVVVPSTWFDDAVQRECHVINYESANRDSRQCPLSVSRQIVNDQRDILTSEDDYLRLLYPCRQYIWSQYSCDPLSVLSTSDSANSSTAYRRGIQLPHLHVSDTEAASANSASLLSPSATTRSSYAVRSRSKMASPPQDVVTAARCSEITAAKNIALALTPNIDVRRTPYCDVSQQAGYDEDIPMEHCMTTTKRNSQQISDKPDDVITHVRVMNNESYNESVEFSNANTTDNTDTDRTSVARPPLSVSRSESPWFSGLPVE